MDVAGGTLKAMDSEFDFLTRNASSTTVATGAKLDLNGFSATVTSLFGAGSVVNAGASAVLSLGGGTFAGVISGKLSLDLTGTVELTNVNTYTGSTTIESGKDLFLLGKGSVAGSIIDNGLLYVDDSSGTFTAGLISGAGVVDQVNVGTLVLGHANTFTGGANLAAGTTLIGNGKGLGTGAVVINNAALIGTATEIVANNLTLQGADTLAAATGTTMTLTGGSDLVFDAGSSALTLTIGSAADKGTVAIGGSPSETVNFANPIHIKVAYGTLRGAKGGLSFPFGFVTDVTVAAGATLDLGGSNLTTPSLTSPGAITNSSAVAATLFTTNTSSVSGVISGKLSVNVGSGVLTLSGIDTYTGGTTISGGATLVLTGAGAIKGAIADNGSLVLSENGAESFAGVISGTGTLAQDGHGVTTLTGANTYSGGTFLHHGKFIVGNGKALGTQSLEMDNGTEIVSTATMSLVASAAGTFSFSGATTIAAAHGTILTLGGAESVDVQAGVMNFGDGANDGTVVFKVNGGVAPGPFSMRVNAGTLKGGDAVFGNLTAAATSVTVATGATLDLGGFGATTQQLLGAGKVINSGASAMLLDIGGTFGGVISGRVKLTTGNVTLTGDNTFTGGASITSGNTLQLGIGGATGSIVGAIVDAGTLKIDRTGTVTLAGAISGAGVLTQAGTGVTVLSANNTYSGGTNIQRGVLESAKSTALGTGGTIIMTGGELLATATQTLSHDLNNTGSVTIAVATGKELVLNTANVNFNAGTTFIGDATHKGTILWNVSSSIFTVVGAHIEVRDGTLKLGSGLANNLFALAATGRIDTGATLDVFGVSTAIKSLVGSGTLTNTGASKSVILEGTTNYGGVIAGHISVLDIAGATTLSGNETFTGKAQIESGQSLTLSGLFAEAVDFIANGALVLAVPSRFTGTIENFASGATIDLKNITAGASATLAYNATTRVLTIGDGTHTDTVKFDPGLVLGNFVAVSDGAGGTDINWQTPPPAPMATPAAAKPATPAAHVPAQLVDAMASFPTAHMAVTMLIPPTMPLQSALAFAR